MQFVHGFWQERLMQMYKEILERGSVVVESIPRCGTNDSLVQEAFLRVYGVMRGSSMSSVICSLA